MRPGCGSAPCAHAVHILCACAAYIRSEHTVNMHMHMHVRCAILRRKGRGALMRTLLDAGVEVRKGHARPRATLLDHLDQHACHVQSQTARQARWRRAGGAEGAERPSVASTPFFPPGNEPCAAASLQPSNSPSPERAHTHTYTCADA